MPASRPSIPGAGASSNGAGPSTVAPAASSSVTVPIASTSTAGSSLMTGAVGAAAAGSGNNTPGRQPPQSVADVVAASVGGRRERKRKRIHYSCAECHRRKSKCDRKTPCQPCIDRGLGDTCRPFEDGDEHGDARDRLGRLEDIVEGLATAHAELAKELAILQKAYQQQQRLLPTAARRESNAVAGENGSVAAPAYVAEVAEYGADAYSGHRLPSASPSSSSVPLPRSHQANGQAPTAGSPHDGHEYGQHSLRKTSNASMGFVPAAGTGPLSLSHQRFNGSSPDHTVANSTSDGPHSRRRGSYPRSTGAASNQGTYARSAGEDAHMITDSDDDDHGAANDHYDDDHRDDEEDGIIHGDHRSQPKVRLLSNNSTSGRAGAAKTEPADNFEGGLTVEGGMHGEANWYGALALPSVSRSVIRTEIRGEHLEMHADLPRCPASVMLYRLVHEGGAPPDILQQLMADLPPRKDDCDRLVKLFFRDINWTRIPIHEASFMSSYDELMEFRSGQSSSESGESGGRHAPFLALLFIVLATVKRSQPEEMGSEEDARKGANKFLHGFKKTAAIAASIRIDHIDMLVAHLLAARWYTVNRNSAEAWAALGFGVRAAQAMGLHRDGSKLGLDAVTTERRRRLFSLVQYLDSTTSMLLGRPLGINPAHCDSQPPSDIDIDTMPRSSRPHNAIIYREDVPPGIYAFIAIRHNINRLTARIVEHFQNLEKARQYSDVITIDEELCSFRDSLPAPYQHKNADTSYDTICPWLPLHRYLLNIEIFYFRITLHRPYMLRSSDSKYDFSRRAAIESAKSDRLLREEYNRTVEWPPHKCRRTFMGGLYRLFNATLIFAVALLADPKGPDAADFVSYLDEFIEKHRSADRTDAATRREVRIIELFRAKALDPTWCAVTAVGAAARSQPPAQKTILAIQEPSGSSTRPNGRRSQSRPRSGTKGSHAAVSGTSATGVSSQLPGRAKAGSAKDGASGRDDASAGIHFGDERSVIHTAPPPRGLTSSSSSSSVLGADGAESRGGSRGSLGWTANTVASPGAHGLQGLANGRSPTDGVASIPSRSNGYPLSSNRMLVGASSQLQDPAPSGFPAVMFGNNTMSVSGGSGPGSLARGTPTGSIWATNGTAVGGGGSSGSGSTPAPTVGMTNLFGPPTTFDFSGGLSLGSFGGGGGFGGGFGSGMGMGDADFAQSLFDQLGVSLDQFGLAVGGSSGTGNPASEGVLPSSYGGMGGMSSASSLLGAQIIEGAAGDGRASSSGGGNPDTFSFDFGRPEASNGISSSAITHANPGAAGSSASGGSFPGQSTRVPESNSNPDGLMSLADQARFAGSDNGAPSSTSGAEWAGVQAWGPLVEAIASSTGSATGSGQQAANNGTTSVSHKGNSMQASGGRGRSRS
ncbi:hypothetical protein OC861_003562 [Tilletia horrida]|nr:hypothetical protein OC861_003562 [Tilletia horrida]